MYLSQNGLLKVYTFNMELSYQISKKKAFKAVFPLAKVRNLLPSKLNALNIFEK